jgi:hypothetical protein
MCRKMKYPDNDVIIDDMSPQTRKLHESGEFGRFFDSVGNGGLKKPSRAFTPQEAAAADQIGMPRKSS